MKHWTIALCLAVLTVMFSACEEKIGLEGSMAGRMIKTLSIDYDYGTECMEFGYEADGLPSTVFWSTSEGEAVRYDIVRNGVSLGFVPSDGSEESWFRLDEDGRKVTGFSGIEGDFSVEYDGDRLLSVYSEESHVVYDWFGDNLRRSDSGRNINYLYSDISNNANLDVNWILAGGYDSGSCNLAGLVDMMGSRCSKLVIPLPLYMEYEEPSEIEYPYEMITEDCERYLEYTEYDVADNSAYSMDSRIEDGCFAGAEVKVPVYDIRKKIRYRLKITDYDTYRVDENNVKWYSVYSREIISVEEISREKKGEKVISYHIAYL